MENKVILVDFNDNKIGEEDKLQVHKDGLLHRAFSVFIFDGNKLLIQKRADNKYHSAGLYANTCCSHPRPTEELIDAAHRRLIEEAGICTDIKEVGSFIYYSKFDNGLSEYEYDHVFVGNYSGDYKCNYDEASEMMFVEIDYLLKDIKENPNKYCVWFFNALNIALKGYSK